MSETKSKKHNPFDALTVKEFQYFLINKFFFTAGVQMLNVIVAWQVYDYTHDVLLLGSIGLAEAIPFIIVSLFSGHVADIFDRKKIIIVFTLLLIVTSILLYLLTCQYRYLLEEYGVYPILMIVGFIGVIRGFLSAAFPAIMAQIVPRSMYSNAATWNSTFWHIASVVGPAFSGFLIGRSYELAYKVNISVLIIAFFAFLFIKSKPIPKKEQMETLIESLSVGIKFVFQNQLVLGALSLDLFAVLFGGAVAMLPAIAKDILHVGPTELGFLKAAPAIGAVMMALIIAYKPLKHNAGRNLFLSVGAFGLATILFGLTTNYYWALFFLFLTGAFDNVSVVIRHTILQLSTPDEMRGRVSAVNGIFIGSSNEIGAFESGVTARAFGLKPSIVIGGILTILTVIGISRLSPKLRKLNLDDL